MNKNFSKNDFFLNFFFEKNLSHSLSLLMNIDSLNIVVATVSIQTTNVNYVKYICYGTIVGEKDNKLDLHLSNPLHLDLSLVNYDHSAPVSPKGQMIEKSYREIDKWAYTRLYVVNIDPYEILMTYDFSKTNFTNLGQVNIKTFLRAVFEPYVPRKVHNISYNPNNVISRFIPFIETSETSYKIALRDVKEGEAILASSLNQIYIRCQGFRGSTSLQLSDQDKFLGQKIIIQSNRYQELDFSQNCDGLPGSAPEFTTFNYIPPNGSIVFGKVKMDKNGGYFYDKWFMGNVQFLLFYNKLFSNGPETYTSIDERNLLAELELPRGEGDIDNLTEKVRNAWLNHYIAYGTVKYDYDLFSLLYICIKYDNINKLISDMYRYLDEHKKKIIDNFFRVLTGF